MTRREIPLPHGLKQMVLQSESYRIPCHAWVSSAHSNQQIFQQPLGCLFSVTGKLLEALSTCRFGWGIMNSSRADCDQHTYHYSSIFCLQHNRIYFYSAELNTPTTFSHPNTLFSPSCFKYPFDCRSPI